MTHHGTVLVVEDDEEMRQLLEDALREAGCAVLSATNGAEALERLADAEVDVLVTDHMMPGMKGRELLTEVRGRQPDLPVVIITAFGDIESAVDAMRAGAFHYVAKPFRMEQLLQTVEGALRERSLRQRLASPGDTLYAGRAKLVAESASMRRAIEILLRAAAAETPVLLLGESGSGKQLLAQALHDQSPRRDLPFLTINCSATPESLLESQLFGQRRGALGDARDDRRGRLQEADGGSLFLDQIGDLAPGLQAKLLRALEEKEVHPRGAAAPVRVNVRFIAATHQDLEEQVAQGRFRADLFYRLNVITVRVPPLRERFEDLVPLVAHFLEKHGARLGRPGCTLSLEALEALRRHSWPGNVRELENAIERALVLGRGRIIGNADLPPVLRLHPRTRVAPPGSISLADMERAHILQTLNAVGGNRAAAARLLAVDRKTLYRKLRIYGIASR